MRSPPWAIRTGFQGCHPDLSLLISVTDAFMKRILAWGFRSMDCYYWKNPNWASYTENTNHCPRLTRASVRRSTRMVFCKCGAIPSPTFWRIKGSARKTWEMTCNVVWPWATQQTTTARFHGYSNWQYATLRNWCEGDHHVDLTDLIAKS